MNDERNPEGRSGQKAAERTKIITPGMTILDIVSQHRETEKVFKRWEAELGGCLCCEGLFLTLGEAADRYGFDLNRALADLQALLRQPDS
jgi:hypothetical protein